MTGITHLLNLLTLIWFVSTNTRQHMLHCGHVHDKMAAAHAACLPANHTPSLIGQVALSGRAGEFSCGEPGTVRKKSTQHLLHAHQLTTPFATCTWSSGSACKRAQTFDDVLACRIQFCPWHLGNTALSAQKQLLLPALSHRGSAGPVKASVN